MSWKIIEWSTSLFAAAVYAVAYGLGWVVESAVELWGIITSGFSDGRAGSWKEWS